MLTSVAVSFHFKTFYDNGWGRISKEKRRVSPRATRSLTLLSAPLFLHEGKREATISPDRPSFFRKTFSYPKILFASCHERPQNAFKLPPN